MLFCRTRFWNQGKAGGTFTGRLFVFCRTRFWNQGKATFFNHVVRKNFAAPVFGIKAKHELVASLLGLILPHPFLESRQSGSLGRESGILILPHPFLESRQSCFDFGGEFGEILPHPFLESRQSERFFVPLLESILPHPFLESRQSQVSLWCFSP